MNAERKVKTALKGEVPTSASIVNKQEDGVLVYSGNEKKWAGLFIIVDIIVRMITVQTTDETRRQLPITAESNRIVAV